MYEILHTGHHGYSFWIVTLLRTLIPGVWYHKPHCRHTPYDYL